MLSLPQAMRKPMRGKRTESVEPVEPVKHEDWALEAPAALHAVVFAAGKSQIPDSSNRACLL